MYARAPASVANIGPGFDTLAIALDLHIEVDLKPAESLQIMSYGEGTDLPRDETHLAARVVSRVAGHNRFAITVRSSIPIARGLGTSTALIVASAAAAGSDNPFELAALIDGHADNAAASTLGGFVSSTMSEHGPTAVQMPLDPELRFVVLIPDFQILTEEARAILPTEVPFEDALYNLSRIGLLIAGLADRSKLLPDITHDRLHQIHRTALFPEAPQLLDGLVEAGAYASCWAGAGPGLLGICDRKIAPKVRDAGEKLLVKAGVKGEALLLGADVQGLVTEARP